MAGHSQFKNIMHKKGKQDAIRSKLFSKLERAIKKASAGDLENYDEVRYEGYAPGGVAVIVEALTDNRNRTAGEVRSYFTKAGGALAETGAVSFMFDHVGVIEFPAKAASEDAMMEAAIEAGAEDVQASDDGYEVITLSLI